MSYRIVFLQWLMQSEMLFRMHRSWLWCLFSISFMLLTLILLTYSLLHLRLFCRKNKNISGCPFTSSQGDRCKDVNLHHWVQGSAAVEWMHRHFKLMLQNNICAFTAQLLWQGHLISLTPPWKHQKLSRQWTTMVMHVPPGWHAGPLTTEIPWWKEVSIPLS